MKQQLRTGTPADVFTAFLQLGLTSFGGPVAYLGYFRTAFVERRKWLSEAHFADLVALCQFLPGPASSQVGIAIGLSRAGYLGAVAAWTAFTLPSALPLTIFAVGFATFGDGAGSGWLHGLKVSAVAVGKRRHGLWSWDALWQDSFWSSCISKYHHRKDTQPEALRNVPHETDVAICGGRSLTGNRYDTTGSCCWRERHCRQRHDFGVAERRLACRRIGP